MRLYTIGFTKKSAKDFFEILVSNNVKSLIDVRLNNKSQLAGFTKGSDLEYFLKVIANVEYFHFIKAAPEKELLKKWQNKEINWGEYEKNYLRTLAERKIINYFDSTRFEYSCLLCSEPTTEYCHRRLLAEYFQKYIPEIEIVHL